MVHPHPVPLVVASVASGVEMFGTMSGMIGFFGNSIYMFEGINMILPIYESHRDKKNFPMLLTGVIFGVTCILCTIGSLWYLCYGEDTADTAVSNLDDKSFARPMIGALFGFAAFGSVS